MDDEFDSLALGNTDLEKTTVLIGANQHDKITKVEHADWISGRVEHVFISDAVLAGTLQNYGIHAIKLS